MRYSVRLTIGYRYGAPSDHVRNLVRLLPSDQPGRQRVLARRLLVEPAPGERREATDFFGNTMTAMAFHRAIDRVLITLSATVECQAQADVLDLSPGLPALRGEVADHRSLDARAPHHFMGPSARVDADPGIAAFAAGVTAGARTVRDAVGALGRALHDTMRFETGATDVHTRPGAAFAQRSGVCQDFSHVMIAGLRSLGIPAGYVSGFLRTLPPPGQPRLEGADAMHAWVMAWCGTETGWVEFDPTNACFVGLDHIAVAYGRDYADTAPVKGMLRSSGAQESDHAVDMVPL